MLLANSSQIREADRILIEEHHLPGILLMEEAGRLATEKILHLYPEKDEFLILAGPGNNGGDGLVIARHLFLKQKRVEIILSHSPDRYRGDAKINYTILNELAIPQHIWDGGKQAEEICGHFSSPLLIDSLLGTGIANKLRAPIDEIITYFQSQNYPTVAIDLPSGLDASTGFVLNTPLLAEHTLSFQLAKVCLQVYPAASFVGKVHVLDIGIWPQVINRLPIHRQILNQEFVSKNYKNRNANTHKGTFGHILVIGGSSSYSGAIALTGYAALKSGAGLVSIFCPSACRNACNSLSPELMCIVGNDPEKLVAADFDALQDLLHKVDAVVIGPGMGQAAESLALIRRLVSIIKIPTIWDADALNLLATPPSAIDSLSPNSVLTPHPGEMKRLIRTNPVSIPGEVNTHRLEFAEAFAKVYGCCLLLKGAGTIVAGMTGKSYVNTSGNPGMATAGSGDILSGIIGALLGQGYAPEIAASLAAFLHGKAGDIAAQKYGQPGLLATDIAAELRFD